MNILKCNKLELKSVGILQKSSKQYKMLKQGLWKKKKQNSAYAEPKLELDIGKINTKDLKTLRT